MKATELMIGDFIIAKNYGIKEIIGIRDFDGVVEISESEDSEVEIPYDDIKPISLTPEILEKNGFKFNAVYQVYELHHFGQHIEVDYENDIVCGLSVNITDKEAINTSEVNIIRDSGIYVHQLQRALRCCELWDLAENFKI